MGGAARILLERRSLHDALGNLVPVAQHANEVLVHVVRVLCEQLQLLHVHLLQQRVHVHTLLQALDLSVNLGVALVKLGIVLQELVVLGVDTLEVLLGSLVLGDELGVADLHRLD